MSLSNEVTLTYRNPGAWDEERLIGPAVNLPAVYKMIELAGELWVEALEVGRNMNQFVYRVVFKNIQTIHGVRYMGARLAMDRAKEAFDVLTVDQQTYYYDPKTVAAGVAYWTGTMRIKLLKYAADSVTAQMTMSFPIIQEGLKLGQLIALAVETEMDSLQYWLLLLEKKIIEGTATLAENNARIKGGSLLDTIAFYWAKDKEPSPQPVDKGDWASKKFVRVEDADKVGSVYEAQ
ncbi:hypothetical protein FRC01_001272 [Tulasnella sp. 417]|nr:hypothetical protein FRC01_001272 [Tulasnella sp. 417]